MKELKAQIVGVGDCEDDGDAVGMGMWLDIEGAPRSMFIPLTEDEARQFGGRLYRVITVTLRAD